jgi:hypothetical protein
MLRKRQSSRRRQGWLPLSLPLPLPLDLAEPAVDGGAHEGDAVDGALAVLHVLVAEVLDQVPLLA